MDVICPQCGTTYELDEAQIQNKSVRVKCSACEYMFRVYKPTPSQIIPALQNWIVRSPDGVVSHVPDQATLQRMIVEKKVDRGYELSRDGRAWQLLGDVPDFRPFFSIVQQVTDSQTMLQAVTGSGTAFSAVPTGVAGQAGAVLLAGDLDPSSTLEFGLPSGAGMANLARTEVGVEAVGSEPATQEADVPEGATEVALQGVDEAMHLQVAAPAETHLKATAPEIQSPDEVATSASQEMSVRVSPPSSASFDGPIPQEVRDRLGDDFDLAPVPNEGSEWFTGSAADLNEIPGTAGPKIRETSSSSSLSFDDESDGFRDFSNYSTGQTGDFFIDEGDDFVVRPASRKGLWVVLSIVGIGLILGGVAILQPDFASRIGVLMGTAEATPSSLQKVANARSLLGDFSIPAFQNAKKLLDEAKKNEGKSFPAELASRVELALAETEYRLFQMHIAKEQIALWEKKKKEIDAEVAKIPQDDPEKDQKAKALAQKKKAYHALVQRHTQALQEAIKHYKTAWGSASSYRSDALQTDAKHLKVEMAELHLYSLSANASKKFPPLFSKLLGKLTDPEEKTRLFLLDAWVSLHQQQYSKCLNRLRKVIADQEKWVYPHLLQARAWASGGRVQEALQSISNLRKHHSKHPLAMAYQEYLQQRGEPVRRRPPALSLRSTPPDATKKGAKAPPAKKGSKPPKARPPKARPGKASYRGLLRSANRLRRNERYKSARYLYRRALKIKKTSSAYSGLGWCALELSGPSSAIRLFNRALRMSSRNADALFGLGLAYNRQKNSSKARATLKRFIRRFPRHRDAGEARMILRGLK